MGTKYYRNLGTKNLKIGTKFARVGTNPLRLGTTPLEIGTKLKQEGTKPKKLESQGGGYPVNRSFNQFFFLDI